MPTWTLRGVDFYDPAIDGSYAFYERILKDGTRLVAKVRNENGQPFCHEITAHFRAGARDFGRELAISELERVINENDQHCYRDARTGGMNSMFEFTDIPLGVPVKGSRGRPSRWTDRRLAELIRDLENDDTTHLHYTRRTIRQHAKRAVERDIAEEVALEGPSKTWRLTDHGRRLLAEPGP